MTRIINTGMATIIKAILGQVATVTLRVANGKVQGAKDGKVRGSPRRRNMEGTDGTLTLLRAVRATNFPSPQTKKIIIKALAMARRKPGMTKMLASIHQTPATKSILIITLSRSQAS